MVLFYVFLSLTLIGLAAYIAQLIALRATCSKKVIFFTDNLQPISILKPLKGLDDNLFDNLSSFCKQDYPAYEIIFCIQDHNDPAYKVALMIKQNFPDKDISIVVQRCDIGLNPKVNNLIPAAQKAKYDYLLISDSNVLVDNLYLKTIFTHMQHSEAHLVYNIIKGVGAKSIGSLFENLHLNSFIVSSMCFLDKFLKMPCVVGKSMLMHKKDINEIGGFLSVKDVLAEDYVIGKKMSEAGKKVVLSNYAVQNVNMHWGLKRFFNRHTRWGKLRRHLGGIKYITELISNPVFMSLLPLFFIGVTNLTIAMTLTTFMLKSLGDWYIGRKIQTDIKPMMYFLSPIKDIIIGIIWFVPLFCNTTLWRGNKYSIGKDTMISLCPQKSTFLQRMIYAFVFK